MSAQYEDRYGKRPTATPQQRATCACVMREAWGDEWLVELGATNWIGWTELRRILAERDASSAVVGAWLVAEAEWGAAFGERSAHVLIVGERVA